MNLIRGVRCSAAWRKMRVGYISRVLELSAKAIGVQESLRFRICNFCGLLACKIGPQSASCLNRCELDRYVDR